MKHRLNGGRATEPLLQNGPTQTITCLDKLCYVICNKLVTYCSRVGSAPTPPFKLRVASFGLQKCLRAYMYLDAVPCKPLFGCKKLKIYFFYTKRSRIAFLGCLSNNITPVSNNFLGVSLFKTRDTSSNRSNYEYCLSQ